MIAAMRDLGSRGRRVIGRSNYLKSLAHCLELSLSPSSGQALRQAQDERSSQASVAAFANKRPSTGMRRILTGSIPRRNISSVTAPRMG